MNDSRVNKVINFEGAGWSDADTSKATDMKNCRVRTTFINDEGKKIYLEIGCYDNRKNTSQTIWHKGFSMPWHIDFLFFTKDKDKSCSPEFSDTFRTVREFDKKNMLWFLKNVCNASFNEIETINWIGDRDTTEYNGFSHTGKIEDDFHNEATK